MSLGCAGIKDGAKGRGTTRPHIAYKVLVHIIYSSLPHIVGMDESGWIVIHSVRSHARLLGMTSGKYRERIRWLEDMGYIEDVQTFPGKSVMRLKIRQPVIGMRG